MKTDLEKEFICYKQALDLKKLGFDEPSLGYYFAGAIRFKEYKDSQNKNSEFFNNTVCSIPLYQQAFRWFRDNKFYYSCIAVYKDRTDGGVYYYYTISNDFGINETRHFKEGFFSYEEAEIECLNKLIEIVKNKQL